MSPRRPKRTRTSFEPNTTSRNTLLSRQSSPPRTSLSCRNLKSSELLQLHKANFMRVIVQSLPSEDLRSSDEVLDPSGSVEENSPEGSRIGVELLCVVMAVLKKIRRRVLVGDKVVVGSIDWMDRRGMIENVFQRSSEILDPPVANVNRLLVLFSIEQPKLDAYVLSRFLVEAESTEIPLTLALNKSELADEETLVSWKSWLRSWGYEALFCSVESRLGLDSLAFTLRDQTTVIVGPSGVWKSSLINALRKNSGASAKGGENWFDSIIGGSKCFEDQRVGEVSTRSGRDIPHAMFLFFH